MSIRVFRGLLFLLLILGIQRQIQAASENPKIFRLSLFKEPESLDPLVQKTSNGNYLLHQLFSPLLRYQQGEIRPGLAEKCRFQKPKILICDLKKDLKLSDGKALLASDFAQHYRKILEEKSPLLAPELLALKNAKAIFESEKPDSSIKLGVTAPSQNQLRFELIDADPEFLYRLINPLLTPTRGSSPQKGAPSGGDWATSGPYQFVSWQTGQKVKLKPNPLSPEGHKDRPELEVLFLGEDSVALKLFEAGELDFNRRLPTVFLPRFDKKPELLKVDQVRFDYFGFSPKFRARPGALEMQKAFARGIPYEGLASLFYAKPRPGCFGLPEAWTGGPICLDENIEVAKAEISKLKEQKIEPRFKLLFSQNVDDHKRAVEWLQIELQTRIGLTVQPEPVDTKLMISRLEKGDMEGFRRGLAPDRPTCAGVLESFLPGNSENYLGIDDPQFVSLVKKLRQTADFKTKQKLCRQAVVYLRDRNLMIPTGPIYFSLLLKTGWKGLDLNDINQLDLKDLHYSQN